MHSPEETLFVEHKHLDYYACLSARKEMFDQIGAQAAIFDPRSSGLGWKNRLPEDYVLVLYYLDGKPTLACSSPDTYPGDMLVMGKDRVPVLMVGFGERKAVRAFAAAYN